MVLSLAFTTMQACAQKNNSKEVPQKVLSAFNQKFPNITKVEWGMEDENEWEAEFKMNGKQYSANFTLNGEWKETEYEIKRSEVPATILAILDQNFEDYDLEEAEISETASGKSYEIKIEVEEQEFEVVIDPQGKFTKKMVDEEDEDN